MYIDPVVQEVRRHGAKIAEECGGDVHRMAERLRQGQARNVHRLIRHRAGATPPPPPKQAGQ